MAAKLMVDGSVDVRCSRCGQGWKLTIPKSTSPGNAIAALAAHLSKLETHKCPPKLTLVA